MPIPNYGVVKGRVYELGNPDEASLHATIRIEFTDHSIIRAYFNFLSQSSDSELVYWINRSLQPSELLNRLSDLSHGLHKGPKHQFPGLDLPRSNVAELGQGISGAFMEPGLSHDFLDKIMKVMRDVILHRAVLYVFGSVETHGTERMVHNVHMNQGNSGRFARENGTFEDGGILFEFPDGHWEAILIAFSSQAWATDETGRATGPDLRSLVTSSWNKEEPREDSKPTTKGKSTADDSPHYPPMPTMSDCECSEDSERQILSEIQDRTWTCQNLLHACQKHPALFDSDWIDKISAEFNWWSLGIRAAKSGRLSLDYRIKTKVDLRDSILGLLGSLEVSLQNCFRYAYEFEAVASDFQIAVATSKDKKKEITVMPEGEHTGGLDLVEQVYFIEKTLKYLSRISIAIRKSETGLTRQRVDEKLADRLATSSLEEFQKYLKNLVLMGPEQSRDEDVWKGREPNDIQMRLIRANLIRRNRFDHCLTLFRLNMGDEGNVDEAPKATAVTPQKPRQAQVPTAQSRTSDLGPGMRHVPLQHGAKMSIPPLPSQSATHASSSSIMRQESQQLETRSSSTRVSQGPLKQDYPKCPASEGENFRCPYCAQMLDSSYSDPKNNQRRWRGHVTEDLSPYVCIYPDCNDADCTYVTTDEWKRHIGKSHSVVRWICDTCWLDSDNPQQFEFDSEESWKTHVESEHGDEFDDSELPDLIEDSQRAVVPPIACPLCIGDESLRSPERDKHLSEHLHSFALQSLPWESFVSERQVPLLQRKIHSLTLRIDNIPRDQASHLCNNLDAIIGRSPTLRPATAAPVCLSLASRDKQYMCATVSFETSLTAYKFMDELRRVGKDYAYRYDLKFYGITPLHEDQNGVEVDVVAIHRAIGYTLRPWKSGLNDAVWLRDFLPKDVPHIRVLLYGYHVVLSPARSMQTIVDLAADLLEQIVTFRTKDGTSQRPIVFIAHGLGGVLVKEALIRANAVTSVENGDLSTNTLGFFFFGVPSFGLGDDKLKTALANDLCVDDDPESLVTLKRITDQFFRLSSDNYRVVNFFSDIPHTDCEMDEGGKWHHISSPSKTATEELPLSNEYIRAMAKETHIGLDSFHFELVNFDSSSQRGYSIICAELKTLVDEAKQKIAEQSVEYNLFAPQSEALQYCLKSLAFDQMDDRCNQIDEATSGTCNWLLQHEIVGHWTRQHRGLLLVEGKLGSGKSTLMKYALHELPSLYGTDTVAIAFFFTDHGHELQRTQLGFFRSVVHQLLSRFPGALPYLIEDFEARMKVVDEPVNKRQFKPTPFNQHFLLPSLQQHFEFALTRILTKVPVILFIDALNECDAKSANQLIECLTGLLSRLSRLPPNYSKFGICISYRPYPSLDPMQGLKIRLEDENQLDIATFIKKHPLPITSRDDIETLVIQHSQGLFLWASLVLQEMRSTKQATRAHVEANLRTAPQVLRNIYSKLLKSAMNPSATLRLMRWLCFSFVPLTTSELQWVLGINREKRSLKDRRASDDFVPDDKVDREVNSLGCGLAEVVLSDRGRTVRFIHPTVKGFVIGEGLRGLEGSTFNNVSAAHCYLFRTCLQYIKLVTHSLERPFSREHLPKFPFIRYATESWVYHLERTNPSDTAADIKNWSMEPLIELWIQAYQIINPSALGCPASGTKFTHILAWNGLSELLSRLPKLNHSAAADIDSKDANGRTPLSWAAQNGHRAVVEVLLRSSDVDVNSEDKSGRTPLAWATEKGHTTVMEMLLETGKVHKKQET